jgi:hypothetical protein
LFARHRFPVVIHLAAQAGVRYSLRDPHTYVDANLAGFANILEGCRHNGCRHLLFASSKPAILDFYLTKRIISLGQHLVEKVLSDGANIACWGSFSGVSKNGHDLNMRFADVYRIREGRIDLRRTFFDSPAI